MWVLKEVCLNDCFKSLFVPEWLAAFKRSSFSQDAEDPGALACCDWLPPCRVTDDALDTGKLTVVDLTELVVECLFKQHCCWQVAYICFTSKLGFYPWLCHPKKLEGFVKGPELKVAPSPCRFIQPTEKHKFQTCKEKLQIWDSDTFQCTLYLITFYNYIN